MAYVFKPYEQSDSVNQAQQALQKHQQNKPGEYKSQWQQQMTDLLSQYQNRKPFQYDINADAMYQQMVDRYVQQGKQAMMDTVGQASALTGGYGNSYAQTAGQQTYQGYLQGVNDKLPQFYQMALDRYQDEGNQMLNQYNLMANQEDMEYSRYNDTLNRYLAELDRLQGVYDNERNIDYNMWSDNDQREYSRYQDQQNLALQQVEYLLSIGVQPDAELLDMAGYNNQYVNTRVQQAQAAAMAAKSDGGGGGSGNSLVQQVNDALKKGMDPKIAAQTLANMYKSGDITGKDYSDTYKQTIGKIDQNIIRVPGGGVVNGVLKTKK